VEGIGTVGGAQAEAVRMPLADGTLYKLSVREDDALIPSLLTLSDVMGTGHHAAVSARVAHVCVGGGPAPGRVFDRTIRLDEGIHTDS